LHVLSVMSAYNQLFKIWSDTERFPHLALTRSIDRVDRGEMDPGAKWSFWVIFAFLEEIEQPIIVQ